MLPEQEPFEPTPTDVANIRLYFLRKAVIKAQQDAQDPTLMLHHRRQIWLPVVVALIDWMVTAQPDPDRN